MEIFGEIKNKIQSGYNLREIIDQIDGLHFHSQTEKHELAHLYEGKIKNMGNGGRNGGEYYTPRPLIRAIVQVVNPRIGELIYDGAVGSAGFLCEAFDFLMQKPGLTTKDVKTLQERTFYGKEKKSLAYVIAIMNMILHGIEAPNIIHTRANASRCLRNSVRRGESPCECAEEACEKCGQLPCECNKRARVKLADGKEREIQHIVATTFWHPDGTPMSARQFMEALFGQLPAFFKDEAELRTLWSSPDTRKRLLSGLAEKGFGQDQLAEMQKIINAEKSDLFDVLAYVAYTLKPLDREERATRAKVAMSTHFGSKQRAFLDFVLGHYVSVGVRELDQDKLTPLLRLKYQNSLADALNDLGRPEDIGVLFSDFQKYLYQERVAA